MNKANKYIMFNMIPFSMFNDYYVGIKYKVSYEDENNYYIKHHSISKKEENINYIVGFIEKPKDVKY